MPVHPKEEEATGSESPQYTVPNCALTDILLRPHRPGRQGVIRLYCLNSRHAPG